MFSCGAAVGRPLIRTDHLVAPLAWPLLPAGDPAPPLPLKLHGRYSRAEVFAAFGSLNEARPFSGRVAEGFCPAVENRRGGVTLPFVYLGFTDYVSHEGERPMAIRWRLHMAFRGRSIWSWRCRCERGGNG
ncbi:hypothetical protein [Synechococcus sp. 1G10]|uniref:hypothetical protein n=1 Tax=Synechococcus sp. 1G10 TaxID=2025605 RepID=UPI000B98965A|nr:hypothetical protein [Synechococcus sp. 1G10]